MLISKIY